MVKLEALARSNPAAYLCSVHLFYNGLTSATLRCLGRLHHLRKVKVSSEYLTTAGVIDLLKGASRNLIRKISISRKHVDIDLMTDEVEKMSQERRLQFVTSQTRLLLIYKIVPPK